MYVCELCLLLQLKVFCSILEFNKHIYPQCYSLSLSLSFSVCLFLSSSSVSVCPSYILFTSYYSLSTQSSLSTSIFHPLSVTLYSPKIHLHYLPTNFLLFNFNKSTFSKHMLSLSLSLFLSSLYLQPPTFHLRTLTLSLLSFP